MYVLAGGGVSVGIIVVMGVLFPGSGGWFRFAIGSAAGVEGTFEGATAAPIPTVGGNIGSIRTGIKSVGTGTILTPGPDTAASGWFEPILDELGLSKSSCRRCWCDITFLNGMSITSSGT